MRELGVTGAEVAEFLNAYRIEDNWGGDELPEGFEDRGEENAIAGAWSRRQYAEVMRCAFGSEEPPRSAGLRAQAGGTEYYACPPPGARAARLPRRSPR